MHDSGLHGTIDGASGITQGTKSQNGTDIYYGTETLVKHKRKNRPAGDKNGEHIGHYQLIKVFRFRLDKRFGYETADSIPFVVKGKVIMEHEVKSFTAEEDTLDYWIYDRDGELDSLYKEITKENVLPYPRIC